MPRQMEDTYSTWDKEPLLNKSTSLEPEADKSSNTCSDATERGLTATKIYKRRWYVLGLFSILSGTQALLWNTWGPVSDSAQLVFGWSGADVGLFGMLGNGAYCLTVFAGSYAIDVLGLRLATLSMASMIMVGSVLRCISSHQVAVFWTSVISAILSGVAGTVTLAGPALFSAVWFPPTQRATATAMINTVNFLGISASFLLGPAIVKYVDPNGNRTNLVAPSSDKNLAPQNSPSYTLMNHTASIIEKQHEQIMLYLYIEAGICAFLFLQTLIYFPSKPPLPPSLSASTERLEFKKGLTVLAKNRSFWSLAIGYALPSGLFGVWGSVLNVNLSSININQATGGQVGFWYNTAGGLAGLIVGRCSDLMSRHMKHILIGLTILSAATLWWIIMLMEEYIPFNMPSLFISAILASVFINSGVALYYELSSEMCYPVAEGIIGGYLTLLNNITGSLFLVLLYIPNIGTKWMNWTMFAGTVLSLPLLFMVKARYKRLTVDAGESDTSEPLKS